MENLSVQKELKEAFRLYDKEGNGFIPTSCLKEILRELDDQLSDGDLDGMIQEIDSDGSGTVDFDGEFESFVMFTDRNEPVEWVERVVCVNKLLFKEQNVMGGRDRFVAWAD